MFRHGVFLHIRKEQPVEVALPVYDESKPFISKSSLITLC